MPAKKSTPKAPEETAAAQAKVEAQPAVVTMPTEEDSPTMNTGTAVPVNQAVDATPSMVSESQPVVVPALDEDRSMTEQITDETDEDPTEPENPKSNSRKWLLLIVVLLLILLAIAAAGVFFFTQLNSQPQIISPQPDNITVPTATPTPDSIETLEQTQSSDELDAIQQDLNDTDLNSLDEELNAIDAAL